MRKLKFIPSTWDWIDFPVQSMSGIGQAISPNATVIRSPKIIVAAGIRALLFVREWRGIVLLNVPVVFGGVRTGAYRPVEGLSEYGVTVGSPSAPRWS